MRDVQSSRVPVRRWFVAVALAFISLSFSSAFAQALPSPVFPATVSGNVWTFAGGSATSANAASVQFLNAANAPLYAYGNPR